MLLHNAGLAEGWLRLGTAVGRELLLDDRTRELVVCAIAASTGASYEWQHHAGIASEQGVSAAQLAALRDADRSAFDDRDRAVLAAVDVVGRDPGSARQELADLRAWLDEAAIAELVVVIGFYWMVTRVTLALDIDADPD
jgi:alkylhydroperoxidase family enzyme